MTEKSGRRVHFVASASLVGKPNKRRGKSRDLCKDIASWFERS